MVYFISLQLLHIEQFSILFLSTIVFYFGSFTAHSVATSYINKKTSSHKPITNGMYISSYYCGGALGSFLPGFIYSAFGWHVFLTVLSGFVSMSIVLICYSNAMNTINVKTLRLSERLLSSSKFAQLPNKGSAVFTVLNASIHKS